MRLLELRYRLRTFWSEIYTSSLLSLVVPANLVDQRRTNFWMKRYVILDRKPQGSKFMRGFGIDMRVAFSKYLIYDAPSKLSPVSVKPMQSWLRAHGNVQCLLRAMMRAAIKAVREDIIFSLSWPAEAIAIVGVQSATRGWLVREIIKPFVLTSAIMKKSGAFISQWLCIIMTS
mmetsp:Transcript_32422/g.97579  ORF Transcript_32422/g.97579 Transcript_32422/m.97579 type:complete len:174 (-) Transcript_32422:601-1122(-)